MPGTARATGRIVEEQAHRCVYELVMPAAEISDVLPAVVGLQRLDRARQAPGAVGRLHPGPAVHARGLLAVQATVTCSSARTRVPFHRAGMRRLCPGRPAGPGQERVT